MRFVHRTKLENFLVIKHHTSLEDGIKKTFHYIKKRGVRPFDYHINIEIKNEQTPETWLKKEI